MKKPFEKPPVKEVAFDIRFSTEEKIDYQNVLLDFVKIFSEDYPKTETTFEGNNFPQGIPIPGAVRNRLFSEDRKELIGIGNDLLSIHTLNHKNFNTFVPKIESVLEALKKVYSDITIKRAGLRYINGFDLSEKEIKDILSKDFSFSLEGFEPEAMNNLFVFSKNENKLNIRINKPSKNSPLFLDLDIFSLQTAQIDDILKWAEESHEFLYDAFIKSLHPDYLKEIQ